MSTRTTTATAPRTPLRRHRRLLATLLATAALAALAAPAAALGAPVLKVSSTHNPVGKPAAQGTHAVYNVAVSNSGDAPTNQPITVHFIAPAGLEVSAVRPQLLPGSVEVWHCSTPNAHTADCEATEFYESGPGEEACAPLGATCHIRVSLTVDSNAPLGTVLTPAIEACGGGAAACSTAPDDPVEVGPFGFFLPSFDGNVLREDGDPATQAGSHPYTASTTFRVGTGINSGGFSGEGEGYPLEELQDAKVELPPGLVGNPKATATCTQVQLATFAGGAGCPPASQVGAVAVQLFFGAEAGPYEVGVYNMEVPFGLPALFAFNILGNVTQVYGQLRTGQDYGVDVISKNVPETIPVAGVDFRFWGAPADPSHDAERCTSFAGGFDGCPSPEAASPKAFVSLPTSCVGPVQTNLEATSWQGGEASASFLSHDNTEPLPNPIGNDGCNAVDFSPSLEARPTTTVADSASGLKVDLHVPQHEACDPGPPVTCENAEAHLRDATVTLPEGLTINPSGANGLDGCSLSEFGYTDTGEDGTIHTTAAPATCPDASKQGTLEVETPLLNTPLKGSVYLADPYQNPFNSLLALYLAVNDPQTGVVVKLAGKVTTDPNTGRVTATFQQNPQLPFEDFRLNFFGGAGGALRTPATCGSYSTSSSLTPWTAPDSGPPATPQDTWAISQAPGGGSCPASQGGRPNSPDLDAGSVSPIAGESTPTVVNLRRNDGSQEFSAVNLTLPSGLTGKLAGTTSCSEGALAAAASKSGNQEKANPSCPATSRIGSVDIAAGAGPAPYNTQGTAYLTGPYKGAPLGMAIVTPATAGPFDLGTVVVRVALFVDRNTAQINAVSDPIPSILQGIPLDVRTVQLKLDRPGFTRNGTSCDPSAFSGQLTSTLGQVAPLSERFQLGECSNLGFKPKLSIRLIGGTTRGAHPALRGVLRMPEGGANISKAVIALPHSEFLDQGHIGTVCTRVQFAAKACPPASVYGHAVATSPLVDYAVEGPVYLRSSSNKLPDLVMALQGPPSQPIEVDAVARIDSVNGGIRSSFEAVPDLPLSNVVLSMAGGKKGLLQNSTNICRGTHRAAAALDAQNGKTADLAPAIKNSKCGKAKRKGKRQAAKHKTAGHAAR